MSPIIQTVKENALRFYSDITKALDESGRHVDRMRVKVIGYRDVYDDPNTAFDESPFFEIPAQQSAFEEFVRSLKPTGGGDEPESGLEALAMALQSDWTREGSKRRHVTVLWTDASAHALERQSSAPSGYPSGLPKTLDELTDMWAGQTLELSSKRLILFAPEAEPWSTIGADEIGWENTVWVASRAGQGLDELSYGEVVNAIVHSLG
jgi:hypothetical protein